MIRQLRAWCEDRVGRLVLYLLEKYSDMLDRRMQLRLGALKRRAEDN